MNDTRPYVFGLVYFSPTKVRGGDGTVILWELFFTHALVRRRAHGGVRLPMKSPYRPQTPDSVSPPSPAFTADEWAKVAALVERSWQLLLSAVNQE